MSGRAAVWFSNVWKKFSELFSLFRKAILQSFAGGIVKDALSNNRQWFWAKHPIFSVQTTNAHFINGSNLPDFPPTHNVDNTCDGYQELVLNWLVGTCLVSTEIWRSS